MKRLAILTLLVLFSLNTVCFAAVSSTKSKPASPPPAPRSFFVPDYPARIPFVASHFPGDE